MPKIWSKTPDRTEQANALAVSTRLPETIATLLVARGVTTPEQAKAFLEPKLTDLRAPEELPGCKKVAERLLAALREKKKISVYGDYDVDGITGVAILFLTLRDLGAEVDYYVPSRLDEGYGLHAEAIRSRAENGTKVLITVDCGISSLDEAVLAKELGVELLITDHHNPGPVLPDAAAIAHPQLEENGKKYPFPFLCGSMVALKVAWMLGKLVVDGPNVSLSYRKRLQQMVGFAVLGTIADFVPLLDENRALVHAGMQYLLPNFASIGLQELLSVSGFGDGKKRLDEEFVAFQLAPRLNAAGRLGQAGLAVELLIGDDRMTAINIAREIDQQNAERKELEKKIRKMAEIQVEASPNDAAYVLEGDWHKGVIGIVASRLVEKYHKPMILLAKDKMGLAPAVGSGRSIPGFNLYQALAVCGRDGLLARFGGHDAAAGLTVENKNIETFRQAFRNYAEKNISIEQRTAELFLDGDFPLGAYVQANGSRESGPSHMVGLLGRLAPFGNGNKRPIFEAHGVTLENPKPMGADGIHFSANFRQGGTALRGIAFNRKEWFEDMKPYDKPFDIAFRPKISSYNGSVELEIIDWKR